MAQPQTDHYFVPAQSKAPIMASVALFTRKPISAVRAIALDTSSRTSVALVRILCTRRFQISPAFVHQPPDLDNMLASADAALLIGDLALFADPRAHGAEKIDLGAVWTEMTGLPFVWAFWSGRPDAVRADTVELLQAVAVADGRQLGLGFLGYLVDLCDHVGHAGVTPASRPDIHLAAI